MSNEENQVDVTVRDTWSTQMGFILACVGSAVGMGNIWLFPTRVSLYGGGTFILPYIFFVVVIGYTGVFGEMGLGRANKRGPIGSFGNAMKYRGKDEKVGRALGFIPTTASLLLAIGYTVVVGWMLKYTFGAFTGATLAPNNIDEFGAAFGAMAAPYGNTVWVLITMALSIFIMNAGVSKGIEKLNKFMMPLFYVLFIALAIYISTLPGASDGYRYIFTFDPKGLTDPIVWIFALGQAFFSLSIGGSGTVIYGSYLKDDEDVLFSAKMVAIFDTSAALLAAFVIIPAMATTGSQLSQGGPGLLFIHLPNLFKNMPGGTLVNIAFFLACTFAVMTSIVNLYETPIAALQDEFKFSRTKATIIIGVLGTVAALIIQGLVGEWMDIVSIYINPIGATIAAIMFYWVFGTEYAKNELQKGREKEIGGWFKPMTKYVFVGVTVVVYVAGVVLGGIG
ncbi:MAG TPA: sodium-dependent transporter [Clostridiales bacterium]|jgi:NSS family neurotransmitter:Na+ symporter|nr:sodium-dependent transporter [Clostridiales bacterium]HCS11627.1 sodium-dependent transporter [Clostridiales bacterium]